MCQNSWGTRHGRTVGKGDSLLGIQIRIVFVCIAGLNNGNHGIGQKVFFLVFHRKSKTSLNAKISILAHKEMFFYYHVLKRKISSSSSGKFSVSDTKVCFWFGGRELTEG